MNEIDAMALAHWFDKNLSFQLQRLDPPKSCLLRDVSIDKEGYLYIKGRIKDMIIVAGLNVYSPEVEHVIAEHPKVKEVAVVGVPDKLRGEAVKAVVVLKEDEQTQDRDIRAFCRERLIHFKVPQIVEFRESLPKTRSGKIQKELLKESSQSLVKDKD